MVEFDSMYGLFQSALKKSLNVLEISKGFTNDKDIKDMLQNMWSLKEFHEHIKIEEVNCIKKDEASESFRKSGNECFKRKMLDNALAFYNKSIINAPCPGSEKSSNLSFNLAYGYANRSAVLYELERYDLCLIDIRRALQQNYPIELHEKLIIREIKCNFSENNLVTAQQTHDKYMNDERYKHNRKLLISLNMLMSNYRKLVTIKNQNFICEKLPSLSIHKIKNIHKLFPSVSDDLEFTCSDKGRGFIAKRDIMPGEVLMKERAYSAVLLNSCLHTHCTYCLKRVKYAPVPCKTCTNVIFCDEKCRDAADRNFHKMDCQILGTFGKLDMGKNSSTALRILCQTGAKELVQQFRVYEGECSTMTQGDIGFNPSGVYKPDDFRPIFHLVTNKSMRSVADLFKRCAISLTLFKVFAAVTSCPDAAEKVDHNLSILSPDQLDLAASLFLFSMSLPCNAHSITEYQDISVGSKYGQLHDIGSGAFSTFSLVNHSCNPNMTRMTCGVEAVGVATQLIKIGTEIFDSYGPCFAIDPLTRMDSLKTQYYFNCSCMACIENWPQYGNLPNTFYVKCPNCSSKFDNGKCSNCKKAVDELKAFDGKDYIDFGVIIEERSQLYAKYSDRKLKWLGNQHKEDDMKLVIRIIKFVNMYCVLPAAILLEAQEFLKRSMDAYAYL